MATPFQQRLVGTVILVALGVIFLPDLLSGKKPSEPDEAVSIPLRPELEPAQPAVKLPKEQPIANKAPEVWTVEQTQEAAPVVPEAAPPEPVAPQPEPAPKAPVKPAPAPPAETKPAPAPKPAEPAANADHVVQLGAFRNADNVNALVKKLKNAGYRAYTTPAPPIQGEINRVWVGPDSKARLQQQLPALERLTSLKGSVKPK